MPRRPDLQRIMIISSGPIVIGQGCEFDYSGTQACKALREEGISVVLLNSNPATIMTDPEMADRTYIEPITVEAIDKILARERELGTPVDALLPTLGGQTGLNCAMEAAEKGVLKKHGVQLIGANEQAIHKAEDRTEFKNAMLRIGLDVPRSGIAHTWEEARKIVKEIGLPVAIRPAYTLGGTGGGFATTMEEFETIAKRGLEYSRVSEILIEESALGWKEYELEVMRDRADNVVIICSIENFDAMGVHTGDSITVAPAQTLTDKEYQRMRDAAIKIIREIGVDTGGSNIQFAVHPKTGRLVVVEMNPRVSRSSALASKATGYPIAKIAAKLAIGYTLDEIPNDITRMTPASFEPTIDYCVVKIPRWTFEKFPEANETLTTQMKSVGEAMSIGRTFKEALQKGIRSMEIKRFGLGLDGNDLWLASRGMAFQAMKRRMGFQPMQEAAQPEQSLPDSSPNHPASSAHGQDAHATDHGLEARATSHGQDARATLGRVEQTAATRSHDTAPSEHGDIQKRAGAYLPHWSAEGATYSVTFRLADSLPGEVLEDFVRERNEILERAAGAKRATTAHEDKRLQKLFSEKVEAYLDAGYGECVLRDERAAVVVRDAIAHFDGQRYDVMAWCVMPNHVHGILRPREGHELAAILHSWKSYTANRINEVLNRRGVLWQPEYFDHLIRNAEDFERSIRYVLDNPSAAGLKNWPWCGMAFQGMKRRMGFQPMQEAAPPDQSLPDSSPNYPASSAHGQDAHATDHGLEARATSDGQDARATLGDASLEDEAPRIVKSRHLSEPPADTKEEHATEWPIPLEVLRDKLEKPCQGRPYYIRYAFKMGWTVEQVHALTYIDPWFLENMQELVEFEEELIAGAPERGDPLGLNAANLGVANQIARAIGAADPELGTATPPRNTVREDVRLRDLLQRTKQWGYSDVQIAKAWSVTPRDVRWLREWLGIKPVYKLVDTCAAEFEAVTPYYYSTYETPSVRVTDDHNDYSSEVTGELRQIEVTEADDEIRVSDKPKVIILGGGPNRIGQGIEFDYCCVHAVMQARKMGYETVMINSNPETVSTDYDTSDLLFFEPLTHEDVLNICERLNGQPLTAGPAGNAPGGGRPGLLKGVIVQYGGQTPLNLAKGLKDAGVPILGTSPESIHLAEDRNEFQKIIRELNLRQPDAGIAYDLSGAIEIARKLGYPVLVRPSYVLGGRAMEKCHIEEDLVRYMKNALDATDRAAMVDEAHPILIDKFLSSAVEVDVDCISDGNRAMVCGIMEHIEEAGIHSGDSACALPPYTLSQAIIEEIKGQTELIAARLQVCGLMNVQYAVKDDLIYLIEVNPRASRTIPFVSKATGVPWAKLATQVMLGRSLDEVLREHNIDEPPWPRYTSVKEVVFPFNKFPEVDVILGPEMRSTGEVMGIDRDFAIAFAKSQMAAGSSLPTRGTVLISVNDRDKQLIVPIARAFHEMDFRIISTARTREALLAADIPAELVKKQQDPEGPYLIDMIHAGQVNLLINTPIYWGSAAVESRIRSAAVMHNIPLVTTITGARAAAAAIQALRQGEWGVCSIQEYHGSL